MRVTSKGQVTIPKHIRRRQGIRAGSEVEFAERGATIVVTKAAPRKRAARSDQEFAAYLERVTGIVDIGMTTDEFMELLRGK
jgi:AbrB family looped-hinge helix DNA binding protein